MCTSVPVIETRDVTLDYGLRGVQAIIDHPKHGRLFICNFFGGGDLEGGAVRWKHGCAVELRPDDTFATLDSAAYMSSGNPPKISDYTTVLDVALTGRDPERPMVFYGGLQVEMLAASAGFISRKS